MEMNLLKRYLIKLGANIDSRGERKALGEDSAADGVPVPAIVVVGGIRVARVDVSSVAVGGIVRCR